MTDKKTAGRYKWITMLTLLPFLLFLSILLPPLVIIYPNTSLSFFKRLY